MNISVSHETLIFILTHAQPSPTPPYHEVRKHNTLADKNREALLVKVRSGNFEISNLW